MSERPGPVAWIEGPPNAARPGYGSDRGHFILKVTGACAWERPWRSGAEASLRVGFKIHRQGEWGLLVSAPSRWLRSRWLRLMGRHGWIRWKRCGTSRRVMELNEYASSEIPIGDRNVARSSGCRIETLISRGQGTQPELVAQAAA